MTAIPKRTVCSHCGETCINNIVFDEMQFCCTGCQTVYALLHQHHLADYYCLNERPGIQMQPANAQKFAFLEDPIICSKLISFSNGDQTHVTFYLPQIHCSSCLWLLEHLQNLHDGVVFSKVNFFEKRLSVSFLKSRISLRGLAELLAHIGYEPHISLQDIEAGHQGEKTPSSALKLGITGFCFANIMLISFPEYLGLSFGQDAGLATFFRYLNLLLALPVLWFGAKEFFVNALNSVRQKQLNIDAPIALAITITFLRSIYEIASHTGAGYLDSMSGIVFFMLIGRSLQNRTSGSLRFNRDHRSYFPIAVSIMVDGKEQNKKIEELQQDDILVLHHQEIIPVDGILAKGKATIDYSFVTGESVDTLLNIGEIVYAGGKVTGGNIELIVLKPFSQSAFTRMWNNPVFKAADVHEVSFVNVLSKYFSFLILSIALGGFTFWTFSNATHAWNVLTAVLIVACPCSLLLSSSFVYGFVMQMLATKGLFVKNISTIERLSQVDHIVFDKTGTLTEVNELEIRYEGSKLSVKDTNVIVSLMDQSVHPLGRALVSATPTYKRVAIEHFKETLGMGMEAWVNQHVYKIGSAAFVQQGEIDPEHSDGLFIAIDNKLQGRYIMNGKVKEATIDLIRSLPNYTLSLLSGDNEKAKNEMQFIFPHGSALLFRQSPQQKLEFIQQQQQCGHRVLMIGDGLNDAGALKQSDVGISVVKQTFSFSPACDAVLDVQNIGLLPSFIRTAKLAKILVVALFIYSILYNIIGLYFALSAQLQPMVAAILMPASSVSIILFSYISIRLLGNRYFPKS